MCLKLFSSLLIVNGTCFWHTQYYYVLFFELTRNKYLIACTSQFTMPLEELFHSMVYVFGSTHACTIVHYLCHYILLWRAVYTEHGVKLLQALGKMTRAWSEVITVKSPKGSPYPIEEHDMV